MPSYCTVFSPLAEPDVVREALLRLPGLAVQEAEQGRFSVTSGAAVMVLTPRVSLQPGDAISKTVLGAWNFFNRIHGANPSRKAEVCDRILTTKMLVGVVAEPDFDPDGELLSAVLEIARRLQGVVFAGDALIDCNDRLLLDASGAFDP